MVLFVELDAPQGENLSVIHMSSVGGENKRDWKGKKEIIKQFN